MSDIIWRCPNGHSGVLDKPEYGGPPTLPTSCPLCGATTLRIPAQSVGDLDQTLAPEPAANLRPEPSLTFNAPRDPLDVLGSTFNLNDSARLPSTSPDATFQD